MAMSEIREEREAGSLSGWLALPVWLALLAATLWHIFAGSIFLGRPPINF
jgi:hypothetical protein